MIDYARMCYIFSNTVVKALRYLPKLPETTIARYMLEWSLLEAKEIFLESLEEERILRQESGEPLPEKMPLDASMFAELDLNGDNYETILGNDIDWVCKNWNFGEFDKLIDYDYFDNSWEDLSGIDLTGFFPDDKPRKFQYRYGPNEKDKT